MPTREQSGIGSERESALEGNRLILAGSVEFLEGGREGREGGECGSCLAVNVCSFGCCFWSCSVLFPPPCVVGDRIAVVECTPVSAVRSCFRFSVLRARNKLED